MRVRHVVGAVALALLVGGTTAATAQYPPTVSSGRVSRSEVKQCQCVQFSGDGFAPGSPVAVVDVQPNGTERVVATAVADAKGEVRQKVCFDETAAQGRHTLVARGADPAGNAHEDRATVTVEGSVCYGRDDEVHPNAHPAQSLGGGPQPDPAPAEPRSVNVPAVASGTLLALGAGLLLLLLARRRRRDEPTPAPA